MVAQIEEDTGLTVTQRKLHIVVGLQRVVQEVEESQGQVQWCLVACAEGQIVGRIALEGEHIVR